MPEHSCKKCGATEWMRNGKSWRCRPCKLEHSKAYYKKNIEYRRAKRLEYIEEHREEIYKKNTEWRNKNRESERARLKKHYTENKHLYRAKSAVYRAKQSQSIPLWFDKDEVEYIYSIAREKGLEVDHIVPITSAIVCGLHVQDNLRCIPSQLNKFKGARYWPDMPLGG